MDVKRDRDDIQLSASTASPRQPTIYARGVRGETAMKILLLIVSATLLASCGQPKTYMVSEESDDRTCRSHVKNCSGNMCSTHEDCRKELVDFANRPIGAPAPGTVSVPAGSTVVIVPR
jgi:hypothetical protein